MISEESAHFTVIPFAGNKTVANALLEEPDFFPKTPISIVSFGFTGTDILNAPIVPPFGGSCTLCDFISPPTLTAGYAVV